MQGSWLLEVGAGECTHAMSVGPVRLGSERGMLQTERDRHVGLVGVVQKHDGQATARLEGGVGTAVPLTGKTGSIEKRM